MNYPPSGWPVFPLGSRLPSGKEVDHDCSSTDDTRYYHPVIGQHGSFDLRATGRKHGIQRVISTAPAYDGRGRPFAAENG
jgi:hypothetical protein